MNAAPAPQTVLFTVLHNVAAECRMCGEAVTENPDTGIARDADGRDRCHTGESAGKLHMAAGANWDGYIDGHPLVPVFTGVHRTAGASPEVICDELFAAFNDGGMLPGASDLSGAYFGRRLRSLSVGDVISLGDAGIFAVARAGFTPAGHSALNRLTTWHEDAVTVILPPSACTWCRYVRPAAELEPFNQAGNLACRDTRACGQRLGMTAEDLDAAGFYPEGAVAPF